MKIDASKVPVEIIFESAKREIAKAVEMAQNTYAVPAYLLRGYLYEEIAKIDETHREELRAAYGKLLDAAQSENKKEEDETGK